MVGGTLPRDLDGYSLPEYPDGPERRHTKWRPQGFRLEHSALGMSECQCPCRIAHPHYLVDDCEPNSKRAGVVAIGTVGMSQYMLPLCGVCAAAQLHGRWREAAWERDRWRTASTGFGTFGAVVALLGSVVGAPFGYPAAGLWLAGGVGLAAAYAAFERWYYDRKAPR